MPPDLTKKIPKEVLANIFSYLDPLGKVNASSVCKRWLEIISECLGLLDDVCVRLRGHYPAGFLEIFSTMSRHFCCFSFHIVIIDLNIISFLKKFGPNFRSLSFTYNKVTVDVDDPGHRISNLVNLLELKVMFSQMEGLFSDLPKLNSLHFTLANKFVDPNLHHVTKITPLSLINLKISSVGPWSHTEMETKMYPEIKCFIENQRSTLRSLELVGIPILDENMANILQIEGLRLKRLRLPRYFSRQKTFQALTTSQPGIVALSLENLHLSDDEMAMICHAFPQLEELSVSHCGFINKSVAQIFQLKRLRILDLSGSNCIKNDSIVNALGTLTCSELRVLHLKYVPIGREVVMSLLTLLPNLRKITLEEGYVLDSKWVACGLNSRTNYRMFLYRPNM